MAPHGTIFLNFVCCLTEWTQSECMGWYKGGWCGTLLHNSFGAKILLLLMPAILAFYKRNHIISVQKWFHTAAWSLDLHTFLIESNDFIIDVSLLWHKATALLPCVQCCQNSSKSNSDELKTHSSRSTSSCPSFQLESVKMWAPWYANTGVPSISNAFPLLSPDIEYTAYFCSNVLWSYCGTRIYIYPCHNLLWLGFFVGMLRSAFLRTLWQF